MSKYASIFVLCRQVVPLEGIPGKTLRRAVDLPGAPQHEDSISGVLRRALEGPLHGRSTSPLSFQAHGIVFTITKVQ